MREDFYGWLRDPNWKAILRDPRGLDQSIRDHLNAENAYCSTVLSSIDKLSHDLFDEMRARLPQEQTTLVSDDGQYVYYSRFEPGKQYPVHYRRSPQTEEKLLDFNEDAVNHPFFQVGLCQNSPNHQWLAYTVDALGSGYYTLHIRPLDSTTTAGPFILSSEHNGQQKRFMPWESVDGARSGARDTTAIVWANDGQTLFYISLDDDHRPSRLYRCVMSGESIEHVLVYEEVDMTCFLGLAATESRKFIILTSHNYTTSEVRYIDADRPHDSPCLITARESGMKYEVSHQGERFLILTNADDCRDFKIVEAPVETPGRHMWRDVVAHRPGRLIVSMRVFRDHVAYVERVDGQPRIAIAGVAASDKLLIDGKDEDCDLDITSGNLYKSNTLRCRFSSLTTPERAFDYDMQTGKHRIVGSQSHSGTYEASEYLAHRDLVRSADGELIPVSILHRRDLCIDGSAPLVLYAYGSYGRVMPPSFVANSSTRATFWDRQPLVDRGLVYAIAHVRGGRDKGSRWHDLGKLEYKTNVFDDYIAVAEHLIEAGYTSHGKIIAHGDSAGGALIGAVLNLRPELFLAAIAEVPLVDVLEMLCNTDICLARLERAEWGDPRDEATFDRIASYSPYDNVRPQAYPPVLATAGLMDPLVPYWMPARWIARLRAYSTRDNPMLLSTNMAAGHSGPSGRFDKLKDVAKVYAFILWACGMREQA